MALADILAALEADADAEIAGIAAAASEEEEQLRRAARDEAHAAQLDAASSLDDDGERRRAQIVNRARLVVERRMSAAVEELYQEIMAAVERRLADVRDRPDYPELFRRLLDECRAVLPDGRVVRVDRADESLCADELANAGCDDFVVDATISTAGGLELATVDGRRSVRNTFESRTSRADRALRSLAVAEVPQLRGGS